MIKNYDPNIVGTVHTVRITFMQYDYAGHVSRIIHSNCKGGDLLDLGWFEYDTQEDIDKYVENDCKLSYDSDCERYKAVLTNPSGSALIVTGDYEVMKQMIVSIEIHDVVKENNNE